MNDMDLKSAGAILVALVTLIGSQDQGLAEWAKKQDAALRAKLGENVDKAIQLAQDEVIVPATVEVVDDATAASVTAEVEKTPEQKMAAASLADAKAWIDDVTTNVRRPAKAPINLGVTPSGRAPIVMITVVSHVSAKNMSSADKIKLDTLFTIATSAPNLLANVFGNRFIRIDDSNMATRCIMSAADKNDLELALLNVIEIVNKAQRTR